MGDAALGGAVAATVSAVVLLRSVLGDRPLPPTAFVWALALGLVVLGRRRHPIATLLATLGLVIGYYAVGLPPIGAALPAAAAFYSVAERGHLRWAAATAVAYLTLTSVVRALEGDETAASVFGYELVASAALLAAVIALGEATRSRRGWKEETALRVAQAAAEREAVARREAEAQRLAIARELHDVLAHTVSVISIHADVAAEAADPADHEIRQAVGTIKRASRDAMAELRSSVRLLRAPEGDRVPAPLAGLGDLRRVVEAARSSGLDVEVVTTGTPIALATVVDTAAQRIVQEALTNVVRHARALTATVELRYEARELVVRLTDDGRGGEVGEPGHGLQGLRERVALLGGQLHAGPVDGGGFRLEATLPMVGGR